MLATVDGQEIRQDAFITSYIDYLVTTGQNDTEALRRRHFDALVDAYLLGAEAERQGLDRDSTFAAQDRTARRRLLGARFYETSVLDTLAVPDEDDVRRAFQLSREQRVIRQLYFTDPAAAQASYERIAAGRPFLEEAWDVYGTRDSTAGLLGAVSYWQLDDAVAEAAFATPVGEVSRPVQSRLGIHIVAVDDRIRNPVLTEDEFARGRKGVESQLRLRRRRMEGDTFVRDFMGERNVSVSRDALVALTQAIEDLGGDPLPDAQQGGEAFTPREIVELRDEFGPETPLATFEIGGRQEVFTVADYVDWLDVLPASEARNRTGASLGRALRNEALARAGEAGGLADAPEVRQEIDRMRRLRLADLLRGQLRADAPATVDSSRLDRAADDLGLTPQTTLADYWLVPFATRAEADAGLRALRAAPASAPSRPGYEEHTGRALAAVPSLAAALRGAPLGEPTLASVGDAWAVVRVAERRTEAAGDAASPLAPFVAEADLIRRLRAERPVEINEKALEAAVQPPAVPQGRR